jgi:DNA replication protein DnaC
MTIPEMLKQLQLIWPLENFEHLTREATARNWTHADYLQHLLDGECQRREILGCTRRLHKARFPLPKALDTFDWSWPKKINRAQVQDLFRLSFLPEHGNVVFLGGVGLGKTHLATALGRHACQKGHTVLFTTAVDIINTLAAAQIAQRLRLELKRYSQPELLVIDELGYLPIDKLGADLLFQVFSLRYERGSILLTTNKPFKQWSSIFNNDATLASAVLDRLLHHAQTIVIEGHSYRMKHSIPEA